MLAHCLGGLDKLGMIGPKISACQSVPRALPIEADHCGCRKPDSTNGYI